MLHLLLTRKFCYESVSFNYLYIKVMICTDYKDNDEKFKEKNTGDNFLCSFTSTAFF